MIEAAQTPWQTALHHGLDIQFMQPAMNCANPSCHSRFLLTTKS